MKSIFFFTIAIFLLSGNLTAQNNPIFEGGIDDGVSARTYRMPVFPMLGNGSLDVRRDYPPAPGQMEISMYPNPTRDVLFIKWEGFPEGKVSVDIKDMQGRPVAIRISERTHPGTGDFKVSLGSLPAGVYVLTLMDRQNKWSEHRMIEVLK